ncbi:inverse autotransporter beta domain-containing protein, partial [Xenorhabdus beddingii]|uniref:inverse autotransporter beta domain-containing protein n=1 Tax=Xenorhabdus beddingii TaxID=40578 RepID=UPI001ABFCBDD
MNIVAQIVFPVAGALTPTIAGAKTDAVVQAAPLTRSATQPYRLAAGESVKTVAKRHGLTVTELKKLNQLRTFSQPFSALGAGDEIEVPQSQASQWLAEGLRQTNAPENFTPSAEQNPTAHWLASAASRAAGMLKNGDIVDSAKSQLRSRAVSEANQTLQHWLQRYGTVKLQANVDDRGRLDGSQFDMLLPLYDTEKRLVFTQFGLRHIDSRTTANVGLGQRHFLADGMLGYNAFLDHDITRDHTRFGIGAEYARDFIRFGANGYFRASGWKDGKKLVDYQERPANGFDLRGEGYLPSYPQLGGKLIYEQYFGDEVGLLSEERRQKNPA